MKAGKSLECSDLAMVKFKILRAVSRITTLDFKGEDFGLFKELFPFRWS